MASFIVFFKDCISRRHVCRVNDIQTSRAIYADVPFILELVKIFVNGYSVKVKDLAWHIISGNNVVNRQDIFFANFIGDYI